MIHISFKDLLTKNNLKPFKKKNVEPLQNFPGSYLKVH